MAVPCSPPVAGGQPRLSLSYDSGAGNAPFGLGWSLDLPWYAPTDKGIDAQPQPRPHQALRS